MDPFYAGVGLIARFWIWFFFERVEVRHPERVPRRGPVLLCINHPNNLIDSLLVGSVLPRKVYYLAAAALFRNPLLARLLAALGVIAVHRKADGPDTRGRHVEMFAACDETFDRGRLIAIYPEGATRAEAHLQRIKTGAVSRPARGSAGASSSRSVSRSTFRRTSPPPAADPSTARTSRRRRSMRSRRRPSGRWSARWSTSSASRRGRARAVEALYRGELERQLWEERGRSGRRRIDPSPLPGSIADAIEHFRTQGPERIERLWQRMLGYHAGLAAYRLGDEAVRTRLERTAGRQRVATSWQTIVGLPLFAYGAAVNFLPYYLPGWLAPRLSSRQTGYATTRLLASVVAFPLFWALETSLVGWAAGLRWLLVFSLSLPLGGLIAYRYMVGTGRLRHQLRFGALLLTRAQEARRLLAERRELLEGLAHATRDHLRTGRPQDTPSRGAVEGPRAPELALSTRERLVPWDLT